MARIDQLVASCRRHVSLTPRGNLPLSQRVWFLVYPPEDERRMVNRIPKLETASRGEGLDWHRLDLTGALAEKTRELFLKDPLSWQIANVSQALRAQYPRR
jgi:hypothetical protein